VNFAGHLLNREKLHASRTHPYITVAILWLWLIDSVRPTFWDVIGAAVCLLGMSIIILGARPV
jgi:small multidrug resistance family-3 protein